jgi:hypothetical protein
MRTYGKRDPISSAELHADHPIPWTPRLDGVGTPGTPPLEFPHDH